MLSRSNEILVTILTLSCLFWGLLVLGKPVHIDEANFLSLTTGDWLQPHNININWQGQRQLAFDVLSNPPGIAWWLWPVRNQDIWMLRLWMLPWSLGALWGAIQLGRFYRKGLWPAALMLVSPIFVLSVGGLMPDMPLLACLLMGWGGYLKHKNPLFLMVMGCAAIFRYNALCFCFIFILFDDNKVYLNLNLFKRMVFVFCPILTLFIFDLWSYGAIHFLHMISFQTEQISLQDRLLQAPALLSMCAGGVGIVALPRLFQTDRRIWFIAFVLSLLVFLSDDWTLLAGFWNVLWVTLGTVLSLGMLRFSQPKIKIWSLWWLAGFVFLMGLRFSATRYWMPFFFIYLLMFVFQTPLKKIKQGFICSFVLSGLLFFDDYRFAVAQYQAVEWAQSQQATGAIAGHWGFQYYAEQKGWISAEDDQPLQAEISFLLRSAVAWPQEPILGCMNEKSAQIFPVDSPFLPHVHQRSWRANYHASAIYDQPPVRSFAPFAFGSDPYEHVVLYQRCDSF